MCLLYVAITRAVYQCNIFLYLPSSTVEKKYFHTLAIIRLITKNSILDLYKLDIKKLFIYYKMNCKYIKNIFVNLNNYERYDNKIKRYSYLTPVTIINSNNINICNFTNIKKIYNYSVIFSELLIYSSLLKNFNLNKINNIKYMSYLDPVYDKCHLPRGKNIGIILHKILEEIDFVQFSLYFKKFTLDQYDIDIKYHSIIKEMIKNVLYVNLYTIHSNLLDENINFLSKEFEFYIPINKKFNIKKYYFLINKYDFLSNYASKEYKLQLSSLYGYINGVIDVLFRYKDKYYIIDYKSH